jgi:hypothetical protein
VLLVKKLEPLTSPLLTPLVNSSISILACSSVKLLFGSATLLSKASLKSLIASALLCDTTYVLVIPFLFNFFKTLLSFSILLSNVSICQSFSARFLISKGLVLAPSLSNSFLA